MFLITVKSGEAVVITRNSISYDWDTPYSATDFIAMEVLIHIIFSVCNRVIISLIVIVNILVNNPLSILCYVVRLDCSIHLLHSMSRFIEVFGLQNGFNLTS